MSIVFWRKMISNLEQFQTNLTKFKERYLKKIVIDEKHIDDWMEFAR